MEGQVVKTLFITLRRSFAGTRERHIGTLKSLGLSYREQTSQMPNSSSIRGAIDTVKHMISVETDIAHAARKAAEAARKAPRPPITVQH